MKYARLDGVTVVEIIEPFFVDGVPVPIEERFPAELAATMRECPDEVVPGWRFDGVNFEAPPAPELPAAPSIVTMRQARLALLAAGLLDDVTAAIDALPSPQKEAARIEWEFAANVDRAAPVVAMLAQALDLGSTQLDDLFTTAAEL